MLIVSKLLSPATLAFVLFADMLFYLTLGKNFFKFRKETKKK